MADHYERFFVCYHKLLSSDNYVTRRQALKLLGELLLDRSFFDTMTRYIASPDNLLMVMNMLKESSKNIQFEAFHVFKVAVVVLLLVVVVLLLVVVVVLLVVVVVVVVVVGVVMVVEGVVVFSIDFFNEFCFLGDFGVVSH